MHRSRLRSADKPTPSEEELQKAVSLWLQFMPAALCLDPRQRLSASELLRMPLLAVSNGQTTNGAAGASQQRDTSDSIGRTQSVPVPQPVAFTRASSNGAPPKDPTVPVKKAPSQTKKLLLNPFRRVTSSGGGAGGHAPASGGGGGADEHLVEKVSKMSTEDHLAPKGTAAHERQQVLSEAWRWRCGGGGDEGRRRNTNSSSHEQNSRWTRCGSVQFDLRV